MKSQFQKTYDIIMEQINGSSLDSKRHGLQKIDQMNTKKFLDFLREILPLFKDNQLDLNKVTITEKPDGSAIRLIVKDGRLLFESSYSGVVEWDKMPFPEQAEWMKKNLEDNLLKIQTAVGFDFKIIGELIWCDKLVENGKVTPVGASYLANKFGSKGGIIIIDLKKIENNELTDLDNEVFSYLTMLLKSINTDEFVFYSKQEDMQFTKSITLSLDINQLISLLKKPEYNKPRYTIKDKAIIDEVEQIKQELLNQLEDVVNSTTGHFSDKSDLIEGLVLTVLDSHNEYGVFSKGYKAMKEKYHHYSNDMESLLRKFWQDLFGTFMMGKIKESYDPSKKSAYEAKFNEIWPDFIADYNDLADKLKNDKTVPLATKTAQISVIQKKLNNFNKVKSFDDLVETFGIA